MAKMRQTIRINAALSVTLHCAGGTATLEPEAAAAGDPGKVRKFTLLAYTGGKAYLPNFPIPVVFDLSTLKVADGMPIPALKDHDNTKPVGHVADLVIAPDRITGVAITSAHSDARDEVVMSAQAGFTWQLSVGVIADRENLIEVFEGESRKINGQVLQGPFVLARHAELREITFTATGADAGGAVATLAASLGLFKPGANHMRFADYVKSLGLKLEDLTAAAVAALRTQWKALPDHIEDGEGDDATAGNATAAGAATGEGGSAATGGDAGGTQTAGQQPQRATGSGGQSNGSGLTEFEQREAEAVTRVAELQQLNAQYSPAPITVGDRQVPLLAHAISNRWNRDQFEVHCLRERRPAAPGPRQGGNASREVMLASLVGAFLHRMNVPLDHQCFSCREAPVIMHAAFTRPLNDPVRQQWMEESHSWRGHSMVDLFAAAARLDGIDLSQHGHWRSENWIRAAFSSTAITDMFTQSVNARLMMSWAEQSSRLLELVEETDVPNFMLNERKQVELSGGTPRPLANQGVAKDITLSATGETLRAKMYSDRFQFSEQDLFDERFDTLKQAGMVMGQRARRLVFDLIAYCLIGNPTMSNTRAFFNATDGNLNTSQGLDRTNLIESIKYFETQQQNGVNIDVRATHLIVSKAKRFEAAELVAPSKMITGESVTRGDFNSLAGQIDEVISDARIDNGFTDPTDTADVPATIAGVPTSWWLADARYPAIEVAYVAGHGRAPRLRSGVLGNGTYGFWYDCSMACGAAPVRRHSIQRNDA